MLIQINDSIYEVRQNYLHRGAGKSRLVLNAKKHGKLMFVQFDDPQYVLKDLKNKEFEGQSYLGWLCWEGGYEEVKVKILNNN